MQDVPTIERKVDELAAWLRTVKAHKQKKTRIAMDYPMPTWDIGLIGQSSRPDTDAMWNKIRLINRRFRAEILPLVGAVCVQAYWCVRWGDITKDLFGEGPIWGNFRMWQVHACALSALTDKPTVALFSPSIVSLDESRFPPRALTEEECGQAMFYLSAMGFSEMVMWGTVEGNDKTPGGWNRYDPAAMETTLRYVGDDGEFLADPGWHYLPTPA